MIPSPKTKPLFIQVRSYCHALVPKQGLFGNYEEEKNVHKNFDTEQTRIAAWALTDLLLTVRQFHCHVAIRNGEIVIDGKKLLQVVSMIKAEVPRVEVDLSGDDEAEALDYIRHSKVGRFITED